MRRLLFVILLVAGFLGSSVKNALPQVAQSNSPTWQETMDWLGPAFNSSAHATTTSTCNGEPATTDSEKATIARYAASTIAVTELYIRQITQTGAYGRRTGMLMNPAIDQTWHLTLNTLSPDIIVDTYDRPGGGPCHYDRQPWYTLTFVTTDKATITSDDDPNKPEPILVISFYDKSMATRCAAAISHLITLAGGRSRKPPPF